MILRKDITLCSFCIFQIKTNICVWCPSTDSEYRLHVQVGDFVLPNYLTNNIGLYKKNITRILHDHP